MTLRISGVTLPAKKQIAYALTAIYGIGIHRARLILTATKIPPESITESLSEQQAGQLRSYLESGEVKVEGDLRREVVGHIRRLKEIGSYRGSRHAKKLPVRGQRTKTNSRTARGNVRRTVGSGRKPTAQKT